MLACLAFRTMHTQREYLILESQNDQDLSRSDLYEIAVLIERRLEDARVSDILVATVAHEAVGVGNQWSDILNVFIPSHGVLTDIFWTTILDQLKTFMRSRFSRRHEEFRPRVIVVRNADSGAVERVLQAKNKAGEFVELEVEVVDSRLPPALQDTTE